MLISALQKTLVGKGLKASHNLLAVCSPHSDVLFQTSICLSHKGDVHHICKLSVLSFST